MRRNRKRHEKQKKRHGWTKKRHLHITTWKQVVFVMNVLAQPSRDEQFLEL